MSPSEVKKGSGYMLPTPTARDYKDTGSIKTKQKTYNIRNSPSIALCVAKDSVDQLNPDWVEPLMGYPIGWTDLYCDSVVSTISEFVIDPDTTKAPRVTSRKDLRAQRLKQLGNSIVPQVASEIFKKIKEAENDKKRN